MPVSYEHMQQMLNPRSIAVVGASDDSPWSIGFMKNLESFGGPVHLVNPRRTEAFGRPCYPSLLDLPAPVDHVCVLVASHRVAGVLRDAGAQGIRSATVIAAGFSEAGPEGQLLSDEVEAVCREYGIAIIGPNCYGFNNYTGTYVSRYAIDVPSIPGSIALSFQSGQLGAATADAALARGIPLRYVVSSGNELITDTNDYLEYFVENPDVTVLGGVFERIPEPARFSRIARRALELGKPIVALKPGRSAAAARIAVAHTGSITGSDVIADAYLRNLGIIRVDSVEELAETAGLLAARGWPKSARTVFCGFSGGAAELFADEAHNTSIMLEPHSEEMMVRLAEVSTLEPSAIHNPFDMTVDGGVRYAQIVETLAASPDYDVIISQGQPERSFGTGGAGREDRAAALMGAAQRHGKFAVFLETGDTQPGLGVFGKPKASGAHWVFGINGVRAISKAIDYGIGRNEILTRPAPFEVFPAPIDSELLAHGGQLSEIDSKALLAAYGIPVARDVLTQTPAEAVAAAGSIGYPVVLKVAARNVAHKSDVGGVIVGVTDDDGVTASFESIVQSVTTAVPDAEIEGIIVSRQAIGGHEFIAGITSDPQLGPMVVAGLGGVYVEVFKDAALGAPPLSLQRATDLIRTLKSAPLLEGTRGGPPLDVAAFAEVLCRLGQLALDHSARVTELDINPIFVFPEGQGVLAVDALVVLADAQSNLQTNTQQQGVRAQ